MANQPTEENKQQIPNLADAPNARLGETIDASTEQIEQALGLGRPTAPTRQYIQAIFNQWSGAREQALADLQVYMQSPVGVGDHMNIGENIKQKIQEVDKYDSLVTTLQKYFVERAPEEAP